MTDGSVSGASLQVLDLFSGIGGFSLGLERAGFRSIAFCEVDPFCRRVLAKHWPEVPIYDDVRSLTADRLAADGLAGVDVVCGGFPCQDISIAGEGVGLDGGRSGLWRDMLRIVAEVRPRWVIIENVAVLRSRGLHAVMAALDALGYVGEWHSIPATAVGAPHSRDRLWIVAHAERGGRHRLHERVEAGYMAAYPGWRGEDGAQGAAPRDKRGRVPGPRPQGRLPILGRIGGEWIAEPDVDRVAHGIPARVDRRRALGNAVVPQIVEVIGRAILSAEQETIHA